MGSIPITATNSNKMEENKEKKIKVFATDNVRLLVSEMNRLGLNKDDIISIIKDANQYLIIYVA